MSSKLGAALLLALSFGAAAGAGDARPAHRTASVPSLRLPHRVAFMGHLRDGSVATVYADGDVSIAPRAAVSAAPQRGRSARALRAAAPMRTHIALGRYGSLEGDVPGATRRQILFDLAHPPQRYVPERVLVAFAPNVTMARDSDVLSPAAARSQRTRGAGEAARRQPARVHQRPADERGAHGARRGPCGPLVRARRPRLAELAARAGGSTRAAPADRVRQHVRAARRRRVRRRRRSQAPRAARRHVRRTRPRRQLDDRRAASALRRGTARDRGLSPLRENVRPFGAHDDLRVDGAVEYRRVAELPSAAQRARRRRDRGVRRDRRALQPAAGHGRDHHQRRPRRRRRRRRRPRTRTTRATAPSATAARRRAWSADSVISTGRRCR